MQTAMSPVYFASNDAASAAPSSCLTCMNSMAVFLLMASMRGFRESPGNPYILFTPDFTRASIINSATVFMRQHAPLGSLTFAVALKCTATSAMPDALYIASVCAMG